MNTTVTCVDAQGKAVTGNLVSEKQSRTACRRSKTLTENKCPTRRNNVSGRNTAQSVTEYHRLTTYLNATHGILTQPERKLLLDFVDDAKRESARLRRVRALRR